MYKKCQIDFLKNRRLNENNVANFYTYYCATGRLEIIAGGESPINSEEFNQQVLKKIMDGCVEFNCPHI